MAQGKKTQKTTSFLSAGLELKGNLKVKGGIRIDGKFIGNLTAGSTVYLGEEAHLDGEVITGSLISSGQIKGNIFAEDTVKVSKPGSLKGNVEAAAFILDDAIYFQGKCKLLAPKNQKKPSRSLPKLPRKPISERD